uniref:Protein SZT2-like n=1 Tax=Saccoglossus kowalevskii TaxID=10224 RepID=A0ABM0GK63_SACKO|nr:PREDICTED: protein SZT2-like [Saccoglossus kowalevskii]
MMLLQDLNDTRICNPLLVAESDEDAWKQDNFLTLPGGMPRSKSDLEDLVDSYQANKGYLMDTMKFSPGHFACECKWQTHIAVHPRLKSGTTRMGPSRGIQAVRTILHQLNLAVSNRKNMFVYKETKGNNVFYLRLYESDNTSVYPAHVPLSPKSDSVSKASSLMSLVPDDQLSVNGSRRPSVRDSGLDTISVTSRTSSLSKEVCESIKIDVHGITEASSEISKDLVEVLKNRLDESTLDVIAMMMERNPLCKLASADVQFIQPRGEAPTTCIYFIVPQYWSSQMYAIGYYLRQNLQQFLHHPKYLDGNPENHFQAFSMKEKRHTDQEIPEKHVFIYHRPHSDGGKGLACIGLSMIDGVENTVNIISSPRPMVETQSDPITSSQFELYTSVDQYFPEPSQDRKAPGPTALIQLCIWERGNVDIPQLTNKLQLAMRYSLCDVIMEYKVLTTTLGYTESYSLGPSRAMSPTISPICTEISKGIGSSPDSLKQTLDPGSIKSGDTSLSTSPVNITYKRHGISMADVFSPVGTSEKPYFFRQQRSKSATPLSEQFSPPFLRKWIQPLKRSSSIAAPEGSMQKLLDAQMSCKSSRRPLYDPAAFQDSPKVSPAHSRSMSPMTISKSPKGKVEDISNVQEIEGQHQRRLLERIKYHQELAEGLRGVLHPIYRDTCVELLDWAYKLGVPSLHKMKASLTSRFSVDIAINEFLSLIRSVSSDVTLKVFQEMGDGFFYPIDLSKLVFPYSEDKSESSFSSPLATSSTSLPSQPGSTKKYIVIGRNMHQWRCTVDTGLPGDEIPNYPSLINQDTHKSFQRFDPLDPGLSTCGGEDERKLVVPRQRLLHMQVNDKTITLYTYNWSSELNGTLDKLGNRLFQWHNARSHLLQCIVNQKLGLFQHRNFGDLEDNKGKEMNPYCRSSDDIDKLVKRTAPPMREHSRRGPSSTMRSAPSHHIQPGVPVFDEILRDQVPVITMQRCSYGGIKDPVMRHGSQFMQIYAREKEEAERRLKLENLYLMWQQRGAHSNMAISDDSLEILKQSSRLVHYCATPLLFSPLWRQQVLINGSSTPARVLSSTSLYKQNVLEEPWHNELRLSFVQHYIQYLQNLGFVQVNTRPQSPKRSPRLSRRTQMRGGSAGGSTSSLDVKRLPEQSRLHLLSQSTKTLGPSYYLQKAVPGGIMLMELTFQDCHFLVKLHALEASRLPAGRAVNPQLSVLFTQECDKFKDLVHVHSFTYDFHLRYIQSYLTTRHCILKPSYHVTSFLSDFVRYYSPGPNFSRNHVCEGVMNFRSKHTAADILFEYMLKNCPTYGMKAMKMNKNMTDMESMDDTDYIMVAMTPRGGIFEDSDGIKHQDEFDISIIISLDKDQNTQPPQSEQQIISQVNTSSAYQSEAEKKKNMVLKYYVILTSRRDLFPKLTLTKQLGKLRSMDIPPKETTHGHLLILTQARTVRDKINIIVNQVEMHCRRDMLWERLLIQDAVDEDPKRKKKKGLESKEAAKDFCAVYKEAIEEEGCIHVPDSPNKILLACHEHVEYVVNTACYHMWASML